MRRLSYAYAMVVIENHKLWVYDYVNEYYKCVTQARVYLDAVHLMETYDSAHMDDTSPIMMGEELENGFNQCILPPTNPHQQGKPHVRRIESQQQGVKVTRCSNYGEVDHYRNSCRNPHADIIADHESYLVQVEGLFGGNY